MTPGPKPRRPAARARILAAAIDLFSRHPYGETSLRDIAARAEVDVAYVHRSFGSKAELFRAALLELMQVDHLMQTPLDPEAMLDRMCDQSFPGAPRPEQSSALPLDMILRSCTAGETRDILREAMREHFQKPLLTQLGEDKALAVALATSLLLGITINRNALRTEPLHSTSDDRMRQVTRALLRQILTLPEAVPAEPDTDRDA